MVTFSHYWPFMRGIHRSPVNFPEKGQWHGALMFSLIGAWTNGWVNTRDPGDLGPYGFHYDVTVMGWFMISYWKYYATDNVVMKSWNSNLSIGFSIHFLTYIAMIRFVACNNTALESTFLTWPEHMMKSWHGKTFRIIGPFWRKSPSHRWYPPITGGFFHKCTYAWTSCWIYNRVVDDHRCEDF